MLEIHYGDSLEVTRRFPDACFDLIYVDPPRPGALDLDGARPPVDADTDTALDLDGATPSSRALAAYSAALSGYTGWLATRLAAARRLLRPHGSLLLHLDPDEVHYAKIACDELFGRTSFQNEIIWAHAHGERATDRWSPRHDTILWYVADPDDYTYRYEAIDRVPYMAPGLVGPEKAARGKTPTDTWWYTILGDHAGPHAPSVQSEPPEPPDERRQTPLGLASRLIEVHSEPGARILDLFAGTGTLGEAAARLGRHATLIQADPDALARVRVRLAFADPRLFA